MASMGQQLVELHRPSHEMVGDDSMELSEHFRLAGKVIAWVAPMSADRARHALGTLTDRAIRIRTRAPGINDEIVSGWRVVWDGNEYAVRAATLFGKLWNILAERLA